MESGTEFQAARRGGNGASKSVDVIGIMLRSLTTNQNLALNPRTESEISPIEPWTLTQQAQEVPRYLTYPWTSGVSPG